MTSYAAVTTFNRQLHDLYGARMLASFDRHWPAAIELRVYAEGMELAPSGRIMVQDLAASCPDLVAFKQRHAGHAAAHGLVARRIVRQRVKWSRLKLKTKEVDAGLGYRWDAVRFAHKVFAILDAAGRTQADRLIWLDADIVTFAPVTTRFLDGLMPPGRHLGYLARPQKYAETGFLMLDLRRTPCRHFLAELRQLYIADRLFDEQEWHDGWLIDRLVKRFAARGAYAFDIGGGIGRTADHVFINSRLGAVMDHLKSDAKHVGASDPTELVRPRAEGYWQSLVDFGPAPLVARDDDPNATGEQQPPSGHGTIAILVRLGSSNALIACLSQTFGAKQMGGSRILYIVVAIVVVVGLAYYFGLFGGTATNTPATTTTPPATSTPAPSGTTPPAPGSTTPPASGNSNSTN